MSFFTFNPFHKKWFFIIFATVLIFRVFVAGAQKPSISLTDEEKRWLADHRTLKLGVGVAFPPFMWVEKEKSGSVFKGMVSDYVDLLGKRLGLDMQIVFGVPFNEALARGRDGRIDLFPCLSETPERSEFLLFTEPYLSYPLVIIAREDAPLIGGVEDLSGKRFAAVKHLVVYSKLQNDYSDLDLKYVFTKKVGDNLEAVSLGRADACIINLAVASYYIQRKGLSNLRVAAPVDWQSAQYSMGVRKDLPVLRSIIQKTLTSISQEEKDRISRRWIRVQNDFGVDMGLVRRWALGLGSGVLILFVIFYAWNRRLQKEVTRRTKVEKEIEAHARQEAAIAELGQNALGNADPSTLLQEAVALVGETLDVNCVKILKLLPDKQNFLLIAGVGLEEGLVGDATVGADEDSQAGYTLISEEPVIVEDLSLETRFNDSKLLFDHGIVSGISVIIGDRLHPFGVLGAHTDYRRDFSEHEVNFILSIANVLATAIERNKIETDREKLIEELRIALDEVKTLRGFIPICSNCKKIRDDEGYWNQIETYLRDHSEATFSHGICPECAKKLYPDLDIYPD